MPRLLVLLLILGLGSFPPSATAAPGSSDDALAAPLPAEGMTPGPAAVPVDLPTALEWTLAQNPELIAIRQNLPVSQAAWAVAQQFPTSLNPTLSVDVRPWVFEKNTGQGANPLEGLVSVSWTQPIELGGRTGFRATIARANFNQTQWNILQAELAALVGTYRGHQTATYRREKLRVAQQLAAFNRELVESVQRQMQAGQVSAADAALAEVEAQATVAQWEVARQDYVAALADLRQQIGVGPYLGCLEPSGALQVPAGVPEGDEGRLVETALATRPEIHAAEAQAAGSRAALCLAQADRIPIPALGPAYEKDESGSTFYGLLMSSPVPVLNAGRTLVCQREAEYHRDLVALQQTKQRISNQVQAVWLKWRQVQQLVARTRATIEPIQVQAARMQRLYTAGQSDLVKLLQVRQRLIQAENTELDAVWQATQVYADLLTALGATPLVGSLETPHGM